MSNFAIIGDNPPGLERDTEGKAVMATQAGIGVLIGLGIGSGVTAFLMRRIIHRQDNALQQSITRIDRIQEEHAHELNAALEKMAVDYEQQLAAKIERYQDTHEVQLGELEAEYEARIAALINIYIQETTEAPDAPPPAADYLEPEPEIRQTTTPIPVFNPIPDPWAEASSSPPATMPESVIAPPAKTAPPKSSAAPPESGAVSNPQTTQSAPITQSERPQAVTELGRAAARNRKDAIRAVPQLGKLLKDDDADVRLAAITALQESGSIKAIPFLRQALRDTDSRIVAAASAALSRFKGSKKPAVKKTKKITRRR